MLVGNPDGVYAKVIEHSIAPDGSEVVTLEAQCHRFVLAELNTHRDFSRNSASSRAIPVRKQIEQVRLNPALPIAWPREQKGMQGGESIDELDLPLMKLQWANMAMRAATDAEYFSFEGLHKSVVNRILEPYLWHKVIITSTKWDNFFKQRCSPLAQPEIRVLAECMRDAIDASLPKELGRDDWHMPYVDDTTLGEVAQLSAGDEVAENHTGRLMRMISAARCARVSYLTHDGVRDPVLDLELYGRLVSDGHWSPLEHVARHRPKGARHLGNLVGFQQLRHIEELNAQTT